MTSILALDVAGNPFRWLTPERAAYYQAANKVAWEIGEKVLVLRGGVNRHTGERSILEVAPVIALAKSEGMAKWAQVALPLGHRNDLLFARDRHICAYCGERIERGQATRDHIMPRARGGRDVWENVVTAHRSCNERKGCRTPGEAGYELVYVPYAPCRSETFLLSGRNILFDQMVYLASRLPSHSRARN
ncbi:MAG: HNH endonuclease [Rhodocyclaceae bacterium]|nr:HNH endonuclease [Rhodocyclaceae bacterium]